jgi:tetratricopeptide (TPR) repeat protein
MRLFRWLTLVCVLLLLAGATFVVLREQWAQEERIGALAQAKAGKFAAAEVALRDAATRDPHDVEVLQALARGYLAEKKWSEAEDYLTRWLAERPRDAAALRLRLKLYRDQRRYELARADAQRLVALDSSDLALRKQLANCCFEACRFDEAEQACLFVLQQEPHDQARRSLLAEVYRARGQPQRAAEVLDALLREEPENTRALLGRGTLYCEMDEADKAIPLLQKVLALDAHRQGPARYYLSVALARAGRPEEAARNCALARQALDEELLLDDRNAALPNVELQVRAARALLGRGETRQAVEVLERVLEYDPHAAAVHQLLAEHYERLGQPQRAAVHRRQAGTSP